MADPQPGRSQLLARIGLLALCLVVGAVVIARASKQEKIPPRESFVTFPTQIGPWKGHESERFTDQVMAILGVDEYVSRAYESAAEGNVHLYVGFYESQRQGDTMHSPLNCLPGAGWEPVRKEHVTYTVKANTSTNAPTRAIEVNRIVIQRGLDRQLVMYWYQSHGRVVASEYWGKIYTVLDAMRMNRTDAALVRVIAPIPTSEPESVTAAERVAGRFVETLFPVLSRYLPE